MGVAYNSRIITDGLVLALDAANTKSYPGILDNIVGWRLPSTNYIRGTLLDNDRTWSSEPSTGYSSVILNKTFNAGENFEVIAYWARDYRGIGMVYGPNVSVSDFTGYSVDGIGPYFGALSTSGFPSGYSASFFGQYHSPISGQGAQTTGYWFKWARTGNTLSLQYSATSSSGPWTNILGDVSINSTDKVIIGAGEASSNEVSDLSLISVGPGPYTWTDLSGNGNTGTLTNGPTYSSANGGSIIFDGSNDYVDCPSITVGSGYSIECFFNSSSVVNYRNVYDMNYSTYSGVSGNVGPRFEQFSDGTANWVWSGVTNANDPYNYTTAFPLSANTWYHTVFTMNGGIVNTYVNGNIQNSNISSPNGYVTTFGDPNLGRGFVLAGDRYFSGRISNFKIYNRALTAAEISQNFNALRGRYGI